MKYKFVLSLARMDSYSDLPVLLNLLTTITLITSFFNLTTAVASATTTATSSAAMSVFQDQPRKQMGNILDAVVGAGDFGNWASILSSADPSILPVTATLFIPSESAVSAAHLSPFLLFPYHILPQRFSFSDLRNYPINTRLPTLLPGFSLRITNNSRSNFSIDGVPVTHPDLYQNAAVSAHGVAAPFDYTLYGNFDFRAVYGNANATSSSSVPQPQPLRKPRPGRARPSAGGFVGNASGSGSSLEGTVPKILGFSWVLALMGVLILVPTEIIFKYDD
ncbi:hypothetical protein Cgig2_007007 [Carnegiea gigantea]|uniref:FAS1 domain-containing protein n=1 Tax=Carnegiea gigantea TaxID=171969 RepID=A0A9Q1K9R0_9CARY|nr:hypothetical protein Cgig2_007007 [Carnegiea gigantea]